MKKDNYLFYLLNIYNNNINLLAPTDKRLNDSEYICFNSDSFQWRLKWRIQCFVAN